MSVINKLTPSQAHQKLKQYCAYQERCHTEVVEKLATYGVYKAAADELISKLIEENYLNEERFAIAYVGGKFRTKNWGRNKIKYNLKQKRISDYCIKKGMAQINEDTYLQVIQSEFDKKRELLKTEKNIFIKKRKLFDYLQQHGFETNYINDLLKKM